jgi:HEXXH motif-containing protein
MTFLGDVTQEDFLRRYWRRRPLHVRGGAQAFLGAQLTAADFERLVDRVDVTAPETIARDGDDVTFVQQVDRASPSLAARAKAIGEALGGSSAWIDGVLACDGRSIGCHYDHSDNFVVQQEGVKVWRLHDPSIIPVAELARRLRNEPGLGAMYLPDDHEEFVVEPGDVLYIPLFWVHHGVSRGPSLSLSAVFEAAVDDPGAQASVRAGRRDRPQVAGPPVDAVAQPRLDEGRIHAFFAAAAAPPDPASLVLPQGRQGPHAELRSAVARPYLRRLLLAIVRSAGAVSDPTIATHLCAALRAIQALDDEALERLAMRPELTSWTTRANEALGFQYPGRIEEIALHLGAFVLPALIDGAVEVEQRGLLALPTAQDGLDLLALKRRVLLPGGLRDAVPVALHSGALVVDVPRGPLRIPLDALRGAVPDPAVEPLTQTARGELTLVVRHRWFDDFLPRGRRLRTSPLVEELTRAEHYELIACLDDGLDLVRTHWWEAWDELDAAMDVAMPLHSDGLRPHNESIPAFRGLVRTSARPSYLAAQTLVHETGHNKLNSILDLLPILASDETVHHSPFVGADRPMLAILHGIFAFTVDAHVSARLLGMVEPVAGTSIERYLGRLRDRLAEAHRTVAQHADLTVAGERLHAGFVDAFDALAIVA